MIIKIKFCENILKDKSLCSKFSIIWKKVKESMGDKNEESVFT